MESKRDARMHTTKMQRHNSQINAAMWPLAEAHSSITAGLKRLGK